MAKENDKPKECFIIMPITVPERMLEKYSDGEDHFKNVLERFFIPSIKRAGYKPVPPKAEGSEFIHSHIITNLQTTDLVLCDMSALNSNVFFEFGIRTSLNKPVCVVKDDLTKAPFDTGVLQYLQYSNSPGWKLEEEIDGLTTHIELSAKQSKGVNSFWKKLGLLSSAAPYKPESDEAANFEYLKLRLDSIDGKIDEVRDMKSGYKPLFEASEENFQLTVETLIQKLSMLLREEETAILDYNFLPRKRFLSILIEKPIRTSLKRDLSNIASRHKIRLGFRYPIIPE